MKSWQLAHDNSLCHIGPLYRHIASGKLIYLDDFRYIKPASLEWYKAMSKLEDDFGKDDLAEVLQDWLDNAGK
jgi:hypothetical protein